MSSNMTATEEAHWVAMAQSGQLRMHLKEVVRPVSPRSAPSPKKSPESQVGTAYYSAESGSNPDVPGTQEGSSAVEQRTPNAPAGGSNPSLPATKKGLGLGVPAVRKPGARGVLINADQAPAKIATKTATKTHPHHWRLSEPQGPVTHGVCKNCGAEKDFSTAGSDVMPMTLLSKANLAKRGLATRFKKVPG